MHVSLAKQFKSVNTEILQAILKTPLWSANNSAKMWVKFNGIKMVLVPRFSIILLYSQKISLLNIFHAKFQGQTRKSSL